MGHTILIVDDHPSFRASARCVLESEGFEVIGEAVDGASAISGSLSTEGGGGTGSTDSADAVTRPGGSRKLLSVTLSEGMLRPEGVRSASI